MRLFIEVLLMKMQIRNNKYIFLQYDKFIIITYANEN